MSDSSRWVAPHCARPGRGDLGGLDDEVEPRPLTNVTGRSSLMTGIQAADVADDDAERVGSRRRACGSSPCCRRQRSWCCTGCAADFGGWIAPCRRSEYPAPGCVPGPRVHSRCLVLRLEAPLTDRGRSLTDVLVARGRRVQGTTHSTNPRSPRPKAKNTRGDAVRRCSVTKPSFVKGETVLSRQISCWRR